MGILEELEKEAPRIDAYMHKIIPNRGPSRFVSDPIWELLNRGGKRFRPVMCLLSCKSVGGDERKALHTASVIELFHNFTLIHDDIEDSSEMRRGLPCVHRVYGVPVTINAGDGMLLYTLRALDKTDPKIRSVLYDGFLAVLNGQAIELDWNTRKKQDVTEKDYMNMVGLKTGALISSACKTGGILGGGSAKQVDALSTFGMAVGIAFQIQDDILNLIGEEEKYKKEIGGDITEGKRTLMTIHALAFAPEKEASELRGALNSNTQDPRKIRRAIAILKKSGSVEYAKERATSNVKKAKRKLVCLKRNESTEKLLRLADFLIEREF